MKKKCLYFSVLFLSFAVLTLITTGKFRDIKAQYSAIEPNMENYSVSEVTFLAFERMKRALPDTDNPGKFIVRKKIFDSKLRILENKSARQDVFFHDEQFLATLKKIKAQSSELIRRYNTQTNEDDRKSIMALMTEMQQTLMDLQEITYRIQITNFQKTKVMVSDNSSETEYLSLVCIMLSFIFILFLWLHITRLKETLRQKNIFISAIYHELSGSIQKIQLSSEMTDIRSDAETAEKHINNIKLHSDKLFHQTREILEYSKIEMGNMGLTNSTFPLRDLVREVTSSFDVANNNTLMIKITSENKPFYSDKQKLLSIINNLISNANKNTKEGTIQLSVRLINKALYLYVKDNGCGFDIRTLTYLYRPFNQGAEKATRQGLGLGLTIIRHYVKLLGGKIRVKSGVGIGSSFLVLIPGSAIPE